MNVEIMNRLCQLATQSQCVRAKYSAVAMNRYGRVIGEGWNGLPNGAIQRSCKHLCAGRLRQGRPSNTHVELCYALHAEQAAVISALRKGLTPDIVAVLKCDSDLIPQPMEVFPCTVCARLLMASGVSYLLLWAGPSEGWVKLPIKLAYEQAYRYVEEAWEVSASGRNESQEVGLLAPKSSSSEKAPE